MSTVSVSEARSSLPQLLERVEQGHEVTLTRHGKPVAVLIRPDSLRTRRAERVFREAERIGALIDEARRRDLPPPSISPERGEEIVAAVRAGRKRAG